jgi:hypothetical protein
VGKGRAGRQQRECGGGHCGRRCNVDCMLSCFSWLLLSPTHLDVPQQAGLADCVAGIIHRLMCTQHVHSAAPAYSADKGPSCSAPISPGLLPNR